MAAAGWYNLAMMDESLQAIIDSYDPRAPLSQAWTIPASWYIDPRVLQLERQSVFADSWQHVGRTDQLREPGQYITATVAGEPIVVVRGSDRCGLRKGCGVRH